MLIKTLVFLLLLIILYCLGSALFYTMRSKGPSRSAAKALTWRVGISLILFLLLIAGYYLGWIRPHPLLIAVPQ